jgi:segregation and condensation protein A
MTSYWDTWFRGMKNNNEYEVKLDLFEGPLDLLLYLVQKSEVEIIDISVSEISKQYLEYLDIMRNLNINVASEYLSMAATLIRLKSRELLPESEQEASEEEEGIINREQLIEKLLEYKKFKEAAGSLRTYESEHIGSFSRGKSEDIETVASSQDTSLESITMFDLIAAFKNVLERIEKEGPDKGQTIAIDNIRLDDRIDHILGKIEEIEEVRFEDLFLDDTRKIVLVVTFMAILELIKMKRITFRQEEQFGALFVKKHIPSDKKE